MNIHSIQLNITSLVLSKVKPQKWTLALSAKSDLDQRREKKWAYPQVMPISPPIWCYFSWDLRFQSSAHTQMNMLSTWATKHGMAGSSFPRICKRVPSKHFLFPTRRTFHTDLEPTNTKHWDPISQSTWTSNLLNSFVCKVDPSVFFATWKKWFV